MRLALLTLIGVIALTAAGWAGACQLDVHCSEGSLCIKPAGNLDGMCMDGLDPGWGTDRTLPKDPLDIMGEQGAICEFDTDCGIGGTCVMDGGLYGTCL